MLSKQINHNDLMYFFESKESSPRYFSNFKFSSNLLRDVSDGEITL